MVISSFCSAIIIIFYNISRGFKGGFFLTFIFWESILKIQNNIVGVFSFSISEMIAIIIIFFLVDNFFFLTLEKLIW